MVNFRQLESLRSASDRPSWTSVVIITVPRQLCFTLRGGSTMPETRALPLPQGKDEMRPTTKHGCCRMSCQLERLQQDNCRDGVKASLVGFCCEPQWPNWKDLFMFPSCSRHGTQLLPSGLESSNSARHASSELDFCSNYHCQYA